MTEVALPHMDTHAAANEFPMLDDKRLAALADDIRDNGQREPIRLFRGLILDGRNRYAACELAGVAPRFEDMPQGIDPWAYVWSLNGERRDLTADQRYLIWKSCHEHSGAWAAEAARIKGEASRKRSDAAKGNDNAVKNSAATSSGTTVLDRQPKPAPEPNRSSAAKAQASKTNRGSVERMDKLASSPTSRHAEAMPRSPRQHRTRALPERPVRSISDNPDHPDTVRPSMNLSTGHTTGLRINPVSRVAGVFTGLFRPSPRTVLTKARADYAAARARYRDAERRQDCRAMHDATAPLQRAHAALLRAEMALNPMPPMPCRGVSA